VIQDDESFYYLIGAWPEDSDYASILGLRNRVVAWDFNYACRLRLRQIREQSRSGQKAHGSAPGSKRMSQEEYWNQVGKKDRSITL